MSTKPVTQDPNLPVMINVDCHSPHAVTYRLWVKPQGETEWTILADGETSDGVSDTVQTGPHPNGTLIAWWFGIVGKDNSKYRCDVVFAQGDHVLEGGTCIEEGRTDGDGLATAGGRATLV